MTTAAVGSEVEITELEKIEADRVDGVGVPANGIPFLLMKGLAEPAAKGSKDCPCGKSYDADTQVETCENCGKKLPAADAAKASEEKPECKTCGGKGTIMDGNRDCPDCDAKPKAAEKALAAVTKAVTDGKIDQGPDIDLGHQIMDLLARAIIGEAQEIGAGSYGETSDVDLLNCAASMISRWVGHEAAPGDDDSGSDMGMLMASAAIKAAESAKTQNDLPDSAFAHIEPGGTKDADGKTTPRSLRHFPVHDKAHAQNALARLSSSPFGDKAKAKVHAAAKKFGIDVSDTSKSAVAEGEADVQTEPQTGDLSEVVKAAITEAQAPLKEQVDLLKAELAKVKALPVPGGPMMSVARSGKAEGDVGWAAKAAYYREMADSLSDPQAADGYRQLARQADEKARA